MLAGQIIARGRIDLIDIPEPVLPAQPAADGSGHLIFQPSIACLCGSDLPHFVEESKSYPLEIGLSLHEMIGTVVATDGRRFVPGEQVLAVPLRQVGLFERFVVSENRAIHLDARCSREEAVMAQPLGTIVYALKKLPPVLDRSVAVVGQGPIGQLFCSALRNAGARQVIAVDGLASRLETSRRMGATSIVDTSTVDPRVAVEGLTDGSSADIVIECVGHRDQAFNLCIDLCRHAGRILYFGVPPDVIDGLEWRKLFFKNITVHTSVDPDFERDFPLAMRWIAEKRIDVNPIITHRFPLASIQTAYETFRDRRDGALKVLVDFPAGQSGEG